MSLTWLSNWLNDWLVVMFLHIAMVWFCSKQFNFHLPLSEIHYSITWSAFSFLWSGYVIYTGCRIIGLDAQYSDHNGKVTLQAERCADVIIPETPDPVLTSCGVVLLYQDPQSRLIFFALQASLVFFYVL